MPEKKPSAKGRSPPEELEVSYLLVFLTVPSPGSVLALFPPLRRFDVREFHRTVLACLGPLSALERCVAAYVQVTRTSILNSVLSTTYSVLTAQVFVVCTRYSVLSTQYWVLFFSTRYSVVCTQCSVLGILYFVFSN